MIVRWFGSTTVAVASSATRAYSFGVSVYSACTYSVSARCTVASCVADWTNVPRSEAISVTTPSPVARTTSRPSASIWVASVDVRAKPFFTSYWSVAESMTKSCWPVVTSSPTSTSWSTTRPE